MEVLEGVKADLVAGPREFAGEAWRGLGSRPEQEERGRCPMRCEQFQELGRELWPRTVIEGEGDAEVSSRRCPVTT